MSVLEYPPSAIKENTRKLYNKEYTIDSADQFITKIRKFIFLYFFKQ